MMLSGDRNSWVSFRDNLKSMEIRALVSLIHDCDREVRRRGWHPTYSEDGGYSAFYTQEAAGAVLMTALTVCGIVALVLLLVMRRERAIYRRNQRWLREGPCSLIGEQLGAEYEAWLEQRAADR